MNPRNPAIIKKYFIGSTERYERDIVPAFSQFAASVIETAAPQGHELTLDVGTGTGILARLIAPKVRQVIGIDLVEEMLTPTGKSWSGVVADAHELPFCAATFDLVGSSFGLNATQPRQVFRELHRVLKPGGWLAFHEWSVLHHLDEQISDILATYMLPDDEIPDDLFEMRQFIRSVRPWDNLLQDTDDFAELLDEAGFSEIQVWEDAPVICQLPVADFMAYKLAWANRAAELAAMDEWSRGDCLDAMRAMLQRQANSDGIIHYDPILFRVRARR